MAGEYLEATVDITNEQHTYSGKSDTIAFNVTNTGNAITSFDLVAGFTSNLSIGFTTFRLKTQVNWLLVRRFQVY